MIESELKFKKLLIEKIKYQKEYEKLLGKYEGLKGHAETYAEQKENYKYKSAASENSLGNSDSAINAVKKFINL